MSNTDPDVSDVELLTACLRADLRETRSECRWLWDDRLARLGTLPPIDGWEIAPDTLEELPELAQACYYLGRLEAFSRAGSFLEYKIENLEETEPHERTLQLNDDPEQYFIDQRFENLKPF